MSRKFFIALACLSLLFASLACQFLAGQPAKAPVVEAVEATPEVVLTATEDGSAATAAAEEEAALATEEAAALEQAAFEATAKAEEEAIAAAATKEAEEIMELTAAVDVEATEQALGFAQVVDELREQGVIESEGGAYYRLDDFEEAWAQMGWWQWWSTGYQPKNFVVRAHTAWESASRTANWYDSGCGFVFRALDEKNHYLIFLALDGYVYMRGFANDKYLELGREYYGSLSRVEGEADVMLAADGNKITYFVNGEKIFEREHKFLDSGDLALTLVSGTNKDFGTRCTITDIELWDLTEQ